MPQEGIKIQDQYEEEVEPFFKEEKEVESSMAMPELEKVIVNTSFGEFAKEGKEDKIEYIMDMLEKLTGQKPAPTKSKKDISGFDLREGIVIGGKVTLRGDRMIDFLNRFLNFALPRIRDFQGVKSDSIDNSGNLTIGIEQHIIFPEINADDAPFNFGLEVTIVTSNIDNKEDSIDFFKKLGFPFEEDNN